MKRSELEGEIRRHQMLYDRGVPEISDAAFDSLVRRLTKLAPDSVVLTELGKPLTNEKIRHTVPMLSLQKVYDTGPLKRWHKNALSGKMVVQPKYDGVALSLTYVDGRLTQAATRGDGEYGDDVTAAVSWAREEIDIPHDITDMYPAEGTTITVRGELLMPVSVFQRKYAKSYANPRNLIAGLIHRKVRSKELLDAKFIAYDFTVIGRGGKELVQPLSQTLNQIQYCGFEVGPWELALKYADVERLVQSPEWRRVPYEIDGVVVKVDDTAARHVLGATEHHPRWAVAWKYQGDTGETVLRGVEWQTSRAGTITPVAVMDPVELSGVVITRATLHNYSTFVAHDLRVGSRLVVTRRGGVIPHIELAYPPEDPKAPRIQAVAHCPSCKRVIERQTINTADTLHCPDRRSPTPSCQAILRGRVQHWCKTIGVLGIGPEFIDRMIDAELVRTIVDLYRLTPELLQQRAAFGPQQAQKICAEIASKSELTPARFIQALGLPSVGPAAAKVVAKSFDWEKCRAKWSGSNRATRAINAMLGEYEDLIDALLVYVRVSNEAALPSVPTGPATPFTGKKVVFTGPLTDMDRSVAQATVRDLGGETPTGLTRETDILVVGDLASPKQTSKRDKAARYNERGARIEVISEAEFVARLSQAMEATIEV